MCSSVHEIAKYKAFERLDKEKTSYQISIINNRHVHSIKLSIQTVTETQCNEWTITSTSKPENHYTIKNQQTICQITIYNTRNTTFVYTSIHVYVSTLFSM